MADGRPTPAQSPSYSTVASCNSTLSCEFDYVDKFAGEWDLPGGHLQQDEGLLDGLRREVEEETGIIVENPKMIELFARRLKSNWLSIGNEPMYLHNSAFYHELPLLK